MTNRRRKLIPTIIATALLALCLPIMASAQGSYDPWNRDRDYRRNDNRYGYNQRMLRDSIRRVRHRLDDPRREDRINEVARAFQRAVERLDDRFDNGRDLTGSTNEARRLLEIGA